MTKSSRQGTQAPLSSEPSFALAHLPLYVLSSESQFLGYSNLLHPRHLLKRSTTSWRLAHPVRPGLLLMIL